MKDSEIRLYLLCLGNISKNFAIVNLKKSGLNGYVYTYIIILLMLVILQIFINIFKKHDIR